tara:strand:+ start:12020 stop:12259 length:240 start_codon:yes stop_codon:yes gene_type:complete
MTGSELFISSGAGLCMFIMLTSYKKSKNENIDRGELIKISILVSALILGILMVYNKPVEPVLSEPFISHNLPTTETISS